MAYVCRVLLYVYRGVLYVYSPPCTLPPQKQKQERIVNLDKSDKCDRNDSDIVKNQGPLYEAKNVKRDPDQATSFLGRASGDCIRMATCHMFSYLREGESATGER